MGKINANLEDLGTDLLCFKKSFIATHGEKLWKIFEKHCKECLKKDCQIVIEATNGRVLPEISQMQREKKEFNLLKEVLQIFGGEVVYFESKEERK